MRVVAWNANFNRFRRSLDDSVALLAAFDADVLVISETGKPQLDSALRVDYTGGVPGLAVVVREGLNLEPHPENDAAPPMLAGYHVSGDESFDLLAVWPVADPELYSYHEILMAALDHYSDLLSDQRAVMIGDFNSSTKVTKQRRTHPKFVSAASTIGLTSLYHHWSGESHGEESVSTYSHSSGVSRDFHIDYCFISQALAERAELQIPHDDSWMAMSDHYPLVADIGLAPL